MSVSLRPLPSPVTTAVGHPSPPPHRLHLFRRLPTSVFCLITQLPPLPDKLLHLTHIARTFPPSPLTPLSFACDAIVCTPTLVTQLSGSPPSSCPLPPLSHPLRFVC